MKIDKTKRKKILNGELAILEFKNNNVTEIIEYNQDDFRELINYQSNVDIMGDCITLLDGNQLNYTEGLYKLIHGRKLVIDTFKIYSQYFIDSINENIEEDELWND